MIDSFTAGIIFTILGSVMMAGSGIYAVKSVKSKRGADLLFFAVLIVLASLGWKIFDAGTSMLARIMA